MLIGSMSYELLHRGVIRVFIYCEDHISASSIWRLITYTVARLERGIWQRLFAGSYCAISRPTHMDGLYAAALGVGVRQLDAYLIHMTKDVDTSVYLLRYNNT